VQGTCGRLEKHILKISGFKQIVVVSVGLLGRFLILLLVFGSLSWGLYYAWNSPQALKYFQLREIHFKGTTHVSEESLRLLIQKSSPPNLLQIDLEHVRGIVETEAWVKSAVVRRKLPDELVIYVDERQPAAVAAIDRELYVVDEEGTILDRQKSDDLLDRPVVKGLRNLTHEGAQTHNSARMLAYTSLLAELSSGEQDYAASVSEVDVENPERIGIVLDHDPVPIYLGGTRFLERYQRFLSQRSLYRELKQEHGLIEYIDVSYDNKIIFHTPYEQTERITGGADDHPL